MYSTSEATENITSSVISTQYPNFVNRYLKFLERKREWVVFYRDQICTRNNNTNNYAEATVRILKDVILNRTKAFNAVALVDICVTVWEEYLVSMLLSFAHKRKAAPTLMYEKLCGTMEAFDTSQVQKMTDSTYTIPSQSSTTTVYTVDTIVGSCTCFSGKRGGFCKHQALIHKHYKIPFPNAPPVTTADRHSLAKLALGDKCPKEDFFLGLQEPSSSGDISNVHTVNTGTCVDANDQDGGTEGDCSMECQVSAETSPAPSSDRFEGSKQEFGNEILRLSTLLEPNISNITENITKKLKLIQNSNQLRAALITVSAALSKTFRRGGRIKAQPTAISRRRPGITRGSKRVPAGRPPSHAANTKRSKKSRNLSLNIRNNVPNAKSHGHGH